MNHIRWAGRRLLPAFLLLASLPAQFHFQTEQHPVGGCLSQANTIMHLETAPPLPAGGDWLQVTVCDTVPGEDVLLLFGDSTPRLGGSYLPVFTHGAYLSGPEWFGPWCGWYTNGGVCGQQRAVGSTTVFTMRLPVVPSALWLGDYLWVQALMTDPTPGWNLDFVTSRPIRLRVVA